NTAGDVKTGCQSTVADLRVRVRRLQLGGEAIRASEELKLLKGISGGAEEGQYSVDSMLANHLISEGHVDEAMKLLLKHYDAQKNHPPYLMLLGKASSRAGEYQSAIGAYQRAFDLAPKSREAANALFQAGFTGYQIQDYDGATRRFEKLMKTFGSSAYSRDAKWYLAWIRYLRGDYEGALESFKTLAKAPKVRRGRRARPSDALSQDRLKYWSAMSLLKLGRNQEAIPILQGLVRDPAIGYYSVLSFYRLLSVPGAKLPTGIETRLGLKKTETGPQVAPTEEELKEAAEAVATAAAEAASDETEEDGTTEADVADADGEAVTAEADSIEIGFKDANLSQRFERARDLSLVGLFGDARRELGEIERKARRAEDRRLLMVEYAAVENYNRSSTIGDLGFSQQRLRSGLRGDGRALWEYAYPRAWDASVVEVSKSTGVPEELIWGIMRAESLYRTEVQSPVGAMGLMQIMPFTGRQLANLVSMNTFETRSLLEPAVNIRLGSRYLQRLLEKFSGSVPLVAAGYNAGPHRVHAWVRGFGSLEMDEFIEHIPFLETRNYVKKVVRNFQIYSLLYSGGTHSLRWLVQPVGVELDERIPTKEVW
ncbi:MAG TPA: transglycosylase SLT domain-containing protein, partial [Bdellovibrionales bacterium]|nr:transglycosylase SLT domain-containing protein [Bdellovibrionales bacterium]